MLEDHAAGWRADGRTSGYRYEVGPGYRVQEEKPGTWTVRDPGGAVVARTRTWRKAVFWAASRPRPTKGGTP